MYSISKKKVGVDISDRSIEIVEMSKQGMSMKVSKLGRTVLKGGVVKWGIIKDEEKLKEAFKKALAEAKPSPIETTEIIFGLPESLVFTYVFSLRYEENSKIKELVRSEAVKNIPLPEKDLLYSFSILSKKKIEVIENAKTKKITVAEISLIATNRNHLLMWQHFFQKINLEVEFFDIETLALFRSIYDTAPENHACLVDIGAQTTNISILSKEGFCFSHFIKKAGDQFTENIAEIRASAQGEKIGLETAEKIKEEFGLSKEGKYGLELHLVLNNILHSIIQEIKKILVYHQAKFNKSVSEVVLVGGSSKLKGLTEYFQQNLTFADTQLPASDKAMPEETSKEQEKGREDADASVKSMAIVVGKSRYLPDANSLEYVEAVGIAVRGLDNRYENDPFFSKVDLKKLEKDKLKAVKENAKKLESETKNYSWFRRHKKEAQLLIILAIGLIMIGGAFWFRSQEAKKKQQSKTVITDEFQYEKIMNYDFPILLNSAVYDGSFIRARVFKKTFTQAIDISIARQQSLAEAEANRKQGEKMWQEPLSGTSTEKSIFPLDIEWLIYHESDMRSMIMDRLMKEYKKDDFLLSESDLVALSRNDKNEYVGKERVKILTKQENAADLAVPAMNATGTKEQNQDTSSNTDEDSMAKPAANETSLAELEKMLLDAKIENMDAGGVLIKNTEAGWLNVRTGPGTNFLLLKKVFPGERYPLLEEKNGWIKINLGGEESGWVSGQYVEK